MWFNLKNPWSSSRHMLSRLVGDPRAKSSGRLDTITFASPGFDPVTGVILLQDSYLAAILIQTDPHYGCLRDHLAIPWETNIFTSQLLFF